ncbi:hypothetical protein CCR94_12905 [Rhodoblastus sphagnicola]|uniref:histidine kinase n=1 Tax=Rhodoblastus sphagnicola TaxID=333368 RepID=A0A2S6N6I7_9HYPH|nr:PAS domain-containing sensor histidine kinase [Rhodoblastus sphagnicola]MBB4197678.1 PAS domain S-box-containing protein [Rhodoblastus sphagnicola]PPQ30220.1 hypothetical protein CCR94_12905 [Rhodoblastus sphagnicola]
MRLAPGLLNRLLRRLFPAKNQPDAGAARDRSKSDRSKSDRAEGDRTEADWLRFALEAGAIGIGAFDFESGAVTASEQWREIWGLGSADAVTTDSVDAMVFEDDRAARAQAQARALDPHGSGLYEARFRIRRHNDGALRWVKSRGAVYFKQGVPVRMLGVTRDITDEMEVAAALEEKATLAEQARLRADERGLEQQRLALALEAGAIGAFEADLVANQIHLSDKLRDIWGWTSETPVKAGVLDTLVVEEDQAARNEALARAGNGRYRARFRIRRANDGALRWIDTRGQVQFDGGAPVRVLGVTRDVTDEVEAAAALEEKARLAEQARLRAEELALEQQRLALALEAGAIGTFEIDLVDDDMRLSEKNHEIWGWTGELPEKLAMLDALIVEEDLAALHEARARALSGDGLFRSRFRIRRANDGALRHVDTRARVCFDGDRPVRVFGVARDVTDDMEAAAALEEKARLAEQDRARAEQLALEQQRLKLALEAGAIGLFEVDLPDGAPVVNEKWFEIMGFAPGARVTARNVDALVLEEDRPNRRAAHLRAAEPASSGYFACRYRIHRAGDGALRWIDARGRMYFKDGAPVHVRGVHRDVTDEVEAAAALKEKAGLAERLTLLAEALPGAIYTYVRTADGHRSFSYASPNVERLLGFSPAVCQRDLTVVVERIHPEDVARMIAADESSAREPVPWRVVFRYNHPQRGAVWIEGDGKPVWRDDGVTVWHGYLQDVTARKTATRALAESEAHVRALKDERLTALEEKARLAEQLTLLASALPGAIYTFAIRPDGAGYLPYAAPQIETLLGFGPDMLSRDVGAAAARVHRDDMSDIRASIAESARSKTLWQAKCRYDHPKRGEIWLEAHARPARRDDGAMVWHGYLNDVTARETAAHALADSEARVRALRDERLAALERIAARLAHEVNQPLAAGATLLAVARRRLAPARQNGVDLEGTAQALDKAASQMLRAGQIVSRVREFSRHGEPDKTFRGLHDTIREAIASVEADASFAGLEIKTRLEAARDAVLIDRTQIAEVLVNLLRNAWQASLPAGSRVVVVASRNDDKNIITSVIDCGSGLSEDAWRHLFELFWTTKGSGMGVGLAMSKAIVEAHYGKIWPENGPAEETVLNFSLPLVDKDDISGKQE